MRQCAAFFKHPRKGRVLNDSDRFRTSYPSFLERVARRYSSSANEALFNDHILPTLQKNCATCHAPGNPAGGLSVANFDAVLIGGKHGAAIRLVPAGSLYCCSMCAARKLPACPWAEFLATTPLRH